MTDRIANGRHRQLFVLTAVLLTAGAGLGGCSSIGDSFASGAFVDPAKYELYDCKQLETERKSLASRTADLQKLMNKADTGVAGPVVAEVAYRNDYIVTRASAKLADQEWRKNGCTETPAAAPATRPASPATPGGARKPGR